MRVIAGKSGGIPLQVPRTITRPTTDRVREAIFSTLGELVEGADILDLYAGSGALGIEGLSRGADSVLFVEDNPDACEIIGDNLAKSGLVGASVRRSRVLTYLRQGMGIGERFDVIFADPPYAKDQACADELMELVNAVELWTAIKPGGQFVLESMKSEEIPETPFWTVGAEKKYGETRISYLIKADLPD